MPLPKEKHEHDTIKLQTHFKAKKSNRLTRNERDKESFMEKIKWGVLGTAGIAAGQTIPGMMEARNCFRYAIAGRDPEKALCPSF